MTLQDQSDLLLNGRKPADGISWISDNARTERRAHLVGIAGAGMRSLAEVLLGWGWRLSGSDLAGDRTGPLTALGVRISTGHAAEHLPPETDLVVTSDAVPADNPELQRAEQLGVPVLSYFQTLGRLMRGRHGLAVAGTHGKSTTTAMAADLLVEAGLDPTVVFGAAPLGRHGGGRPGKGKMMLVEACEYRANFLHLPARHAVISGIEPDHFDCFDSFDALERAFGEFADAVPADGLVLARAGCRATARVTAGLRCRVETFGFEPTADWSAQCLGSRRGRYDFRFLRHGRPLTDVRLRVPGRHNVLNALGAAALAWHNGVGPDQIARSLGRFRGLARRMEAVGSWQGVVFLDDYAHHPTEVYATLRSVRQAYPGRRVWCVFQPHQASRTQRLLDEMAASLQNADKLVVCEIFRARESPPALGEVTASDLADKARVLGGDVADVHDDERVVRLLETSLRPGDVLITMGAGDIRKISNGLIQRFRENRAAG
ncbi:MAG: UDP-N-acetylmuramate--L-alanine ligase [Planctomycetota bacterium]